MTQASDVLTDAVGRIRDGVADTADGLDAEALAYRPTPEANSVGWLLWHLTRVEDAHVAVTPLDGFIRVAGTMEFSGFDGSVNPTRVAAIQRAAAEGLRDWDPRAPHRPAWAGLRPMTPDGLPMVGRLAEGLNAWVASGHAMLGLTLAPTTAREIRGLLRGDRPTAPEVSPDRFRRTRSSRTGSLRTGRRRLVGQGGR